MSKSILVHELLVQLKRGNDEAIEPLYAHYARRFIVYSRRKGLTQDEAEDVVQTVFTRILDGGIDTYREEAGGGSRWIWTICRNVVIDMIKQKVKQVPIDEVSDATFSSEEKDIDSEDVDPEKWFEGKIRYLCRYEAWRRISENDREEIKEGKGRGEGRKAWHQAKKRFDAAFEECCKRTF